MDSELQILAWIGKPVLLLLNQSGPPRPRAAEAADEARWSRRLAAHVASGTILTLDAFARCWVQEDRLLGAAADLVAAAKREEMARLRGAWRARNLEVFSESMRILAGHVAQIAGDRELVSEKLDSGVLAQRVKQLLSRGSERRDPAVEGAIATLTRRLDERLRADTGRLIALHGLAGEAKQKILARAEGQFEVARPADVAGTGLVGGLVSGAVGGLAADLSTGGLTLGAGMLIGAIVGALGAGGAARAYNLLQGQEDGRVSWSADFLAQRVRAVLLLYLAVAHFGRGRGRWEEGEAQPHWPPLVDEVARTHAVALDEALRREGDGTQALEPVLTAMARDLLVRLYPEARQIF